MVLDRSVRALSLSRISCCTPKTDVKSWSPGIKRFSSPHTLTCSVGIYCNETDLLNVDDSIFLDRATNA